MASNNLVRGQPINVQAEHGFLHGPVEYKGEKVILTARPDYGVWYGTNEALCLNVLIVEAKKSDIEAGAAQALGYMGEL